MGCVETNMERGSAFAPTVLQSWSQRQNLLPGLALVALAIAGWVYVAYQSSSMGSMGNVAMGGTAGAALFFPGWTAMMVAMMVLATLPLILLYRTIARKRLSPAQSRVGIMVLFLGYITVWAAVGLPVYAYNSLAKGVGSLAAVLPALLLIVGGVYQFTPLKRICHTRCSSPLFFLMQNDRSRPGVDSRKTHTIEPGVAEVPLSNLHDVQAFALAVSRESVELTRAAPRAVAAADFLTYDVPGRLRRRFYQRSFTQLL